MKLLTHFRGPFQTLSGYGVAARQILDFLMEDPRFEVCGESINWGKCSYIHNHPNQIKYYELISRYQQAQQQNVQYHLSIQCTIPNEFQKRAQVNVLCTAGIETDRITKEWVLKCNEADLIIVPSEFSKKVMKGTVYTLRDKNTGEERELRVETPIHVIPHWFEKKDTEGVDLGLNFPTKTNFLHVSQWGNKGGYGEDRKNVANLVRYFYQAFKSKPDVGLVLKVNVINNCEEDFAITKKKLGEIKSNFPTAKCKMYLIHDTFSDEQMWALYKHPQIDALVSFTHGECFGLPLLEAHAAGLPVVATDWSGHTDFLRAKKGYLPVKYEMKEVPECQVWEGVIDKGSRWAEVVEKDALKQLKRFVNDKRKFSSTVDLSWLEDNFSKEAVLEDWREFFEKLFSPENNKVSRKEDAVSKVHLSEKDRAVAKLEEIVEQNDKDKVLFIMPRSAGDVLISTAIVDGLLHFRHTDADFYFATTEPYKPLLDKLVEKWDIKVIDYNDLMMNSEVTREVWDYVYNVGINVQYNFSNWLLGNGEYSVRLLEEFAKNCNLMPTQIIDYVYPEDPEGLPDGDYITFSPGGSKDAKDYQHWEDVLSNLKEMLPEIKIYQTGLISEKLYDGVEDRRKWTYAQTISLIKNAQAHIGVDSFPAHVAAAVETPHLILYGSTDANTVTPVLLGKKLRRSGLQILIETSDRNGCKTPCYKDSCVNRKEGMNCVSNIDPKSVCTMFYKLVEKINEEEDAQKTKPKNGLIAEKQIGE